MIKTLFLSLLYLTLNSCAFTPQPTQKNDLYERLKADQEERDFNLEVKILEYSEKSRDKEVEIIYELKNNSKINVFEKKLKKYKLFFILKMKDGREIAKEKTIYSIILPNTAIIEKEKVYISDYEVLSCSIHIYTSYNQ
jgi:hypothetical protein